MVATATEEMATAEEVADPTSSNIGVQVTTTAISMAKGSMEDPEIITLAITKEAAGVTVEAMAPTTTLWGKKMVMAISDPEDIEFISDPLNFI